MSKSLRLVGAAALVGIIATASAGASGASRPAAEEGLDRAQQMSAFLAEAGEVSTEYARTHLGHYLQMRAKHLIKGGLDIPAGVSFTLRTAHNGYCLTATDSVLPPDSPWQVATVYFKEETLAGTLEVSDNDQCPKLKY